MSAPPTTWIVGFPNTSGDIPPPTRNRGPWTLVYQETFPALLDAPRRKRVIKAWKSPKLIAALVPAANG